MRRRHGHRWMYRLQRMERRAWLASDVRLRGPRLHLPGVAAAPLARRSHRRLIHAPQRTTRVPPVAFRARASVRSLWGSSFWRVAQYPTCLRHRDQKRQCLRASVRARAGARLGDPSIQAASWVGRLLRWRREEVAQTSAFHRRGWGERRQRLECPRAAPLE